MQAAIVAAFAAAVSAPATAGGLIQDPAALKRRFAALVAGSYSGQACDEIPDRDGKGNHPGRLQISPTGQVQLDAVRMDMFAPNMEVGMGRHAGKEDRMEFELVEGSQRHAMLNSTDEGPAKGFIEMGAAPDGHGNVTEGRMCADLDLRAMPLLAASNPLADLMAEAYDTGGQTVRGECKNLGRKRNGQRVGGESRQASYSVGRLAVVLNGQALPLHDKARPLTYVTVGSRLADGTLNGSFEWAGDANFHLEQFMGATGQVASFSFSEGEAKWFCKPK
ncbi:MAG TPA: hypothetical protein VLA61_08215 [Ideonella sp.]|uniref:hypothetical protein n=1 Tax=Ideonella sp. TaxID=1929293 RepID=UPI002CF556C3|nr:hypothetical protein [Ideonella sp.]HSI48237.1 hypothetical protein [Ideonella sp.]